jgi:hypothetical protein
MWLNLLWFSIFKGYMKISITIIALSLAFSTAFASTEPKENFHPIERYQAWYLNIIPGLGSMVVMDDWTGAVTQWIFGGSGLVLMAPAIINSFNPEKECVTRPLTDDPNSKLEKCTIKRDEFFLYLAAAGAIMYYLDVLVYNTYRSITYDKPGSVAYNKYGNFNVTILPDRYGNFNTYLMYSKAF